MSLSRPRSLSLGIMAAALLVLPACSSSDSGTGPDPDPSIVASVSPTTFSVQQGQTTTFTVNVVRTNFEGAINVTVSDLPAGVTVAPVTLAAGATTGDVTIVAAIDAAVGETSVTVTGSGVGVPSATAQVPLTVTAAPVQSVGIALSSGSLSLEQGEDGTIGVTITRNGGFAGAVDIAVSGAPAGVAATVTESTGAPSMVPIAGGSATIAISTSGSAAPGSYTLDVSATADGVPDASASVALTVTSAPPPPPGDAFTWTFCPTSPVWFAVQNEGGPWTSVPVTSGSANFEVTGNTVGIAFATNESGSPTTTINYLQKDEIEAFGQSYCTGPKMLNGTVTGVAATDQAFITVGGSTAFVTGANNGTFSVSNVADGVIDVFGARTEIALDGSAVTTTPNRFFIDRDLEPADGSTVDVDFTGGLSFDPQVQNLGATNLGEPALLSMVYRTAGTQGVIFTESGFTTGPSWTYYGVPDARQGAEDFHLATLTTAPSEETLGDFRSASLYFRTIEDQEVDFGPRIGATTITTTETAPYVRPRVQYTRQAEYDKYWFVSYQQGDREVQVYITDGFQGGADIDYTVPDFSGVAGWMNDWGLQTTGEITYAVVTSGWDAEGALVPATLTAGLNIATATRLGTITP